MTHATIHLVDKILGMRIETKPQSDYKGNPLENFSGQVVGVTSDGRFMVELDNGEFRWLECGRCKRVGK